VNSCGRVVWFQVNGFDGGARGISVLHLTVALLSAAHARCGILRGGPEIVGGRSPQWNVVFSVRAAISPIST
jgi:hypothetical protein